LSRQDLSTIFKEDLYNKENLIDTFEELAWISWHKPLECVWESAEVNLAIWKYYKKIKENNLEKEKFLKIFEKKVIWRLCEEIWRNCEENWLLEKYFSNLEKKLLKISDDDLIPEEVKKEVLKNL
jgi:hypothetical protein